MIDKDPRYTLHVYPAYEPGRSKAYVTRCKACNEPSKRYKDRQTARTMFLKNHVCGFGTGE